MTKSKIVKEIETLTESDFQEFLSENQKKIFVFETESYEYPQYLPSLVGITESCTATGKFAIQR